MSVSIPLSANAQPVVEAFDQVRDAIRRANQEGKSFRDIDLSHPELAGFAQDLARMQQQMEDLLRVSQGTTARAARRVNDIGGLNPLLPEADREAAWERLFTDPAERARLRERAEGYIMRGTSFAPVAPAPATGAPPPAPPAGPPPPRERYPGSEDEGEGGRGRGLFSSALGMAKQGGMFMLGMAMGGSVIGAVGKAYENANEENAGVDRLMRSLGGLDVEFTALRDSVRKASEGLGITYQDALRLEHSYSRIVGHGSDIDGHSVEVQADVLRTAGGFARGWGIGADAAMQGVARADQSGIGPQTFAALVGDAAAQGMQGGNIERVMEAILRHQETQARLLVNAGPGDASHFAAMWAGMNATGAAGLRGDNATALISTMNEALRAGGRGGYASDAVTWHALSRHGIRDPYAMEYFKEGGMFAELPDHTTYYGAVRQELNRQYGGLPKHQRLMAMARHLGITMHQAEALDGVTDADMGRTSGVLGKYGLDASNMDPTAYAEIAKALRSPSGLQEARTALLRRGDISGDEKTALGAASGGKLEELVVRLLAAHGMTQTDSSKMVDATTQLSNKLTELGHGLTDLLTPMKDYLGKILGAVENIAKFFSTGAQSGTGAMPFLGGDSNSTMAIAAAFMTMSGGRGGGGLMNAGGLPGGGRGLAFNGGGAPGQSALTNSANKAAFIAEWGPEAERIAPDLGVSPESILAHWGQETGWGTHVHDFNVGNLQAPSGYTGDTVTRGDTHADGSRYTTRFMAFKSRQEAADAYRRTLLSPRYSGARNTGDNTLGFGQGLAHGHYFENPHGAEDIANARRGLVIPHHSRGTPAPAPPRDQGGGGASIQASFEPLVIIQQDARGNEIARHTLPVRHVVSPMTYGV